MAARVKGERSSKVTRTFLRKHIIRLHGIFLFLSFLFRKPGYTPWRRTLCVTWSGTETMFSHLLNGISKLLYTVEFLKVQYEDLIQKKILSFESLMCPSWSWTCCADKNDLGLLILLIIPPKDRDHRWASPCSKVPWAHLQMQAEIMS